MRLLILDRNEQLKPPVDKNVESWGEFFKNLKYEIDEVSNAVNAINGDETPEDVAGELADCLQLIFNKLYQMQSNGEIVVEDVMDEHLKKLISRGWKWSRVLNISEGRMKHE